MSHPVDALLDFLRAEEARGVTHVHLDDGAKEVLRELHRKSKGTPAAGRRSDPAATTSREPTLTNSPPPEKERSRFEPVTPVPTGGSAAERIAALAAQAKSSQIARRLGSLRETMVFSTGNPEADLMLVGEAPGYHEERQREPFVGPAGQKLNEILKAMGLDRPSVYISNIVKFRPALPNQTTNNRKPTLEEMAACLPFIRAEVGVVRPKCIVALGATAAEGLLGLTGSVAAMRGTWHEFEDIPVRVTYHPAYLLHGSASLADKRKIWEDMLAVMERLGLPISEKQRGYFLAK